MQPTQPKNKRQLKLLDRAGLLNTSESALQIGPTTRSDKTEELPLATPEHYLRQLLYAKATDREAAYNKGVQDSIAKMNWFETVRRDRFFELRNDFAKLRHKFTFETTLKDKYKAESKRLKEELAKQALEFRRIAIESARAARGMK